MRVIRELTPLARPQHDAPHRAARRGLDAGQQLGLLRAAAAALRGYWPIECPDGCERERTATESDQPILTLRRPMTSKDWAGELQRGIPCSARLCYRFGPFVTPGRYCSGQPALAA